LHNAEISIKKSKRGLIWLQSLDAPKELQQVMKFLIDGLAFSLWSEEIKFKYYSTWDQNVLKEVRGGIEPAQVCGESLSKLEAAASEENKYSIVTNGWGSCMNAAVQQKLGKYPVASWNAFLRAYGITETFQEIGPPD
jgi:hypothetical protein